MAQDPRVVAVIDAQNRAHDVLVSAAADVLRYQNTVNGASTSIGRQASQMQRTTETAYRVITRRVGDATEVVREQVQTVTEQLVPAYDLLYDASGNVVNAENNVARAAQNTNDAYTQRAKLFDEISRTSVQGQLTQKASHSPGLGAAVSTVVGADAAIVGGGVAKKAMAEYTKAVAEGATKVEALARAHKVSSEAALTSSGVFKLLAVVQLAGAAAAETYSVAIASGATVTEALAAAQAHAIATTNAMYVSLGVMSGIGKVVAHVVGGIILAFRALITTFTQARLAQVGMFKSLILAVREFGLALHTAIPELIPIALAIIAIVIAVKALIAIFKLFKPEIKEGAAKAFKPWIDAWHDFKKRFLQELAPSIAVLITIFTALGAAVMFVANKILLPALKLFGDSIILTLKLFNAVLLTAVYAIIDVLQPIVDAIFVVANAWKLAFAIINNENMSFADKVKMFGKLIISYVFELVKAIINIWFGLVKAVTRIITFLDNLIILGFTNIVRVVLKIWKFLADGIIDIFGTIVGTIGKTLQAAFNTVIRVINSATEKINKFLPSYAHLAKIGEINLSENFDNGIKELHSLVNKMVGDTSLIHSVQELVDKGLGLDFTKTASQIDKFKGPILSFIKEVQDKYGLSFEAIAKEVGVDLWKSPDLAAAFKKVLEKTKLKLAGLDELNAKLSDVNSKDVKVEINPLIQLIITEKVDADRAREIILPIIDEAFKDGAAGIASQVYKANL